MGKVTKYQATQIETIVYDKINLFIENNGYPPTVRELQEKCGLGSPSTAHRYLCRLEDKGLIVRRKEIKSIEKF